MAKSHFFSPLYKAELMASSILVTRQQNFKAENSHLTRGHSSPNLLSIYFISTTAFCYQLKAERAIPLSARYYVTFPPNLINHFSIIIRAFSFNFFFTVFICLYADSVFQHLQSSLFSLLTTFSWASSNQASA